MRGSVKKGGSSWMFVLDLPRGPGGQRRQQKRRGFRTRAEAEVALSQAIGRVQTGVYVEPSKLTVGHYLDDVWLPAIKADVRDSTYASYQGNVDRHVKPEIGGLALQALTAGMLTLLYKKLQTSKGLSAKTALHVHTVMRKALGDAMRWNLVDRNVATAADRPKLVRREMKTWSAETVREFLRLMKPDPLWAVFLVLCTTGMRRGEVLGLRWTDIDFDYGRIRVRKALVSVKYQLSHGDVKTPRSARSIPADSSTFAVLRLQRARQNELRLALGSGWKNDLDLVFSKPDGSPLHPDTVSDTFDRRVKSSGLPKIRLHDLRHTWATLALEANVPVKVVSDVLGHASTAFTMDTYGHVTPIMMEDLARVVGERIFGGSDPL